MADLLLRDAEDVVALPRRGLRVVVGVLRHAGCCAIAVNGADIALQFIGAGVAAIACGSVGRSGGCHRGSVVFFLCTVVCVRQ
jgi:hypothetical protein